MRGAGLPDSSFWRGKRILLTGHTGFKGSWAALWLSELGAEVTGFGLAPDTEPALFDAARVAQDVTSIIGDLRDAAALAHCVAAANPQIVIHMAAQALVTRSIIDPVTTFATNVQGTINLLEALRRRELRAVLVVTSDKVYANDELGRSFREGDPLGGKDPYSASKAAAEIITRAYAKSYFEPTGVPVATARAGNIIGGGDFSPDRLVPDVFRASQTGNPLGLRHAQATRPWQHVLDCLAGYLIFTEALVKGTAVPRALNFGPEARPVKVCDLAEEMFKALGQNPGWFQLPESNSIEMQTLALDSSAARKHLGWRDPLAGAPSIAWTADWYRAFTKGEDPRALTLDQIAAYGKC